jgi:hypothetical protein
MATPATSGHARGFDWASLDTHTEKEEIWVFWLIVNNRP